MDLHTFHLHTHSALHCGTGQSAGIVDLPIARDKATSLPLVPGSSLRGVLRDELTRSDRETAKQLFGPKEISDNQESFAGALSIGDAYLLVLPVRSLAGIVAYATCPFILKQYRRDTNKLNGVPAVVPEVEENQALCTSSNANQIEEDKIILEDLDISLPENSPNKQAITEQWAKFIGEQIGLDDKKKDEKADFMDRFIILSDNIFSYLSNTATEIRTRIRINEETGVVKDGALWTEENLPSGAVMWGVYSVANSKSPNHRDTNAADLLQKLESDYLLQLGGNSGIGRGLAEVFLKARQEG